MFGFLAFDFGGFQLLAGERHESEHAGAFDGVGQLALVSGANTATLARSDLAVA